MRLWKKVWTQAQVELEVRSDSVTALTLVAKLVARGVGTNLVARELALDLSESPFRPRVVSHIPGLVNVVADILSRNFAPGSSFKVPALLAGVPRASLATRTPSWWRALPPRFSVDSAPRSRVHRGEGAGREVLPAPVVSFDFQ